MRLLRWGWVTAEILLQPSPQLWHFSESTRTFPSPKAPVMLLALVRDGGGLHLGKHQGLLSLGLGHESFLQPRVFHAMKSSEGPGSWETLKHPL